MTDSHHATMIDTIGKMNSALLRVHRNRCLLVRNRNADCLRCAVVCTTGAISKSEDGITVNPDLCIGCGTCATACPTCCLEAANPSDRQLLSAATALMEQSDKRVAVTCKTARISQGICDDKTLLLPDGTPSLEVECLGRVDESFLVQLHTLHARSITLVSGTCENCSHVAGGKLCDEVCASAENLLAAIGHASVLHRTTVAEHDFSSCPSVNRLFDSDVACEESDGARSEKSADTGLHVSTGVRTALRKGYSKTFESKFPHVQEDGTLPHFTPERRLRLFNSLKTLGRPASDSVTTRLWGQVTIDTELCRSCRMCTVFCPTGAMERFTADDGAFGVNHRSTLCVQCRMCETICPEQAISVSNTVSMREFLSGETVPFQMKPLGWNPGAENAIATRMARFIKTDTMQDPQAKLKIGEVAERREYAKERQRYRDEKRGRD